MSKKPSKNQTTGLVLGKFAPFHAGHQYLVETAIKQTDRVIVLIYNCPETIDIPLDVRAEWIRQIYPQVEVIEAWDGPTESGHDPRVIKLNEDYILQKIKEPITHFFCSEWYGDHVSKALGAINCVVDEKRETFPVSGTIIRSNPHVYKKFLHPVVYKDFVKKIVFLGAESTGKTTITRELAKIYKTEWMPELGREYWEKNQIDGKLSEEQLLDLAYQHIEKEEELLLRANRYFFADTNAITTAMFSRYYHGHIHPQLECLARRVESRYDLYFVCDIDIPYEDDGARSGADHRLIFQQQIIEDLERRGINYILLRGDLGQRMRRVREYLNMLEKDQKIEENIGFFLYFSKMLRQFG
ncbi:MAG: AAA family ATPase [Patescibacteria group bacterium]|jgi:nicotinamide riboside kinase/nicotinamide mononucleotide adenylyltransferase